MHVRKLLETDGHAHIRRDTKKAKSGAAASIPFIRAPAFAGQSKCRSLAEINPSTIDDRSSGKQNPQQRS